MRKYSMPFLVILLCTTLFTSFPCKAAIVWSDNFNDGNYDGWTVLNGTFIVEDGILKTGPGDFNVISCPSYGPSTGTWSFDLLANGWTVVYFVGNSQQVLVIVFTGQYYYVQRINVVNNTYSSVTFPGKVSAWQHLNVTRNLDGRICVYNNGTLVVDYVDAIYVPPQDFFELYSTGGEAAIDNIVVSDTVDIQPTVSVPFYMQTWFLASVAVVAVVVVVIMVLLMRRK
jgi:hypothetical protein